MKILAAGGAGFIGSTVVRQTIKNTQNEVINLNKLTYAGSLKYLELAATSRRYCFEKVDIGESNKEVA